MHTNPGLMCLSGVHPGESSGNLKQGSSATALTLLLMGNTPPVPDIAEAQEHCLRVLSPERSSIDIDLMY